MHSKLRDKQFKTITFTERMLNKNLMVLKNKIYNIYIYIYIYIYTHIHTYIHILTHLKRKRNLNITLKIVIKSQGKRIRGEKKSS